MSILEVIKEDLSVASLSNEEESYRRINTMGNRIMANLMVENRKDLMIFGWLLKEVSGELELIDSYSQKKKIKDAKKAAAELISKLKHVLNEDTIKIEETYEAYFKYQQKIRKFLIDELEDECYEENKDFTRKNTMFYIDYLVKNKKLLLDPRTDILAVCSRELARTLNEHGGEHGDYIIYLVFQGFRRYFSYLKFKYLVDEVIVDEREFSKILNNFVLKLKNLVEILDDEKKSVKIANELLGEFGIRHRELFTSFGEIHSGIPTRVIEEAIRIPPDTRNKIVDTLTKSFEKEIK